MTASFKTQLNHFKTIAWISFSGAVVIEQGVMGTD